MISSHSVFYIIYLASIQKDLLIFSNLFLKFNLFIKVIHTNRHTYYEQNSTNTRGWLNQTFLDNCPLSVCSYNIGKAKGLNFASIAWSWGRAILANWSGDLLCCHFPLLLSFCLTAERILQECKLDCWNFSSHFVAQVTNVKKRS